MADKHSSICAQCGATYLPLGRVVICPACMRDRHKAYSRATRRPLRTGHCTICAATTTSLKRSYCLPCSARQETKHKRMHSAAGKARLRSVTIERFDPVEVLERDGWRCHLCGCNTPKRLRGSYEDNAPELDHIVPLAAGGEHSRRNTACACRKCNIAKSDKPLGQMRLMA